jgi:phasin family protein
MVNTGLEDLNSSFMTYAQDQMEQTVSATHELLNCRSLEDITQVQTRFVQESFDRFVRETSKLAQAAANLTKDTTRAA